MALSRPLRAVMLGTALSVLCPVLPVMAQDASDGGGISSREAIALQDEIASLRQQLSQIQNSGPLPAPSSSSSRGSSSSGTDGNMTAQLLERVAALEEQNRQMRGELDQLSNAQKETQANLSKQISDMQFASQNGGSGGGASAPAAAGAAVATSKAAETAPASSDEAPKTALEALKVGNAALKAGKYEDAETNARFAVKTAKSASGKMDSQFLLAQSLAGQKQYRESAVAYYDAYNKAPKTPKAQDSLLGVAASLLAMGDKNSACQALDKLKTEFPTQTPRVKSAAATFRGRAACH
ncbi:tetratricopeptide repeat protein [Gluconobacter cerinus]|uniref:tetratricopeptide repeat protein n=1 Tax=Gluconobacter cerinus TaxID=38307 RepID=UPI001B8D6DD8|nr:tetratricopeptide repeat protein [Gluconobacter cerinus]MBS1024867.1 tetratricopeptide repeat protein [Gluconobacter cerinus]MBS1044193.1 tetratricopeptide repeat protein [Gluconobacter cerinus]